MWNDHGARVAAAYGVCRSRAWGKARRAHLKRQPSCVACKKQRRGFFSPFFRLLTGTVVHHIIPLEFCFAVDRPDLETDSRNLLTLCKGHHLAIGHLGSRYSYFNLHAKICCVRFFDKSPESLYHNTEWERFAAEAHKPLSQWLATDLAAFRVKLDEKFPPR